MRITIRGYGDGCLVFTEHLELDDDNLIALAEKHVARLMVYSKHMLEFEWLDEPDPLQRFTRFGTDPSMMVKPMEWRPDLN